MIKKHSYIAILSLLGLLLACSKGQNNLQTDDLERIATFELDIPEPSGLAINNSGTLLYTVSDATNNVYKLSTTGNTLQTFSYTGNDLEGVTTFTGNKLLLAEERTKEIIAFDMNSGTVERHTIDYENNESNSGLEGIAYNFNDGTMFILNEKNPGLLMRLRANFTIIETYELNFASDYSGVFYDNTLNKLWIVSDQNKTINKCTLTGALLKSYTTSIRKLEGIAVTNDKIYVVSDSKEELYVYKKPTN